MSTDIIIADENDGFRGEKMAGSTGDVVPPLPDKPLLRLDDAHFKTTCERAEDILSPYVYSHAGGLSRIGTAHDVRALDTLTEDGRTVGRDGARRSPTQSHLIPVTSEWIERELSGLATIQKVLADGKTKDVSCPPRLAKNILHHGSPRFRELGGIATAPFLRVDGSICDEPGYDARSRVLYIPNADFPPISDTVSKDESADALGVLVDVVSEFPFASESALSAAIAHILTEAARPALDRVPIIFYTSQYAGSGKSMLSETPSMIVHGVEPALRDWPTNDEEMAKSLLASVVGGDRNLSFDNLSRGYKVRSGSLAKFATQRYATGRKLGETCNISAINLATVSITGNNVSPAGDIARRSLVVRLDGDVPASELAKRVFKIKNLRQHVLAHRVELLTAALILLRGHQQSGHASGLPPLPSFESWSSTVRDALLWLGMADPLETQAAEADDETGHHEEAFKLLAQVFAGREFTAADIAAHASGMLGADGALSGAMVKAGCAEPHNSQKVGYWLRDKRDMFGAGYKLVRLSGKHKGSGSKWQLKLRAPSPGAPSAENLDLVGG